MKVGQRVFVKFIGHGSRENKSITEVEVERVGNKYFYLKNYRNTKFSLEKMVDISVYSPHYHVYLTREEIEHEDEFKDKVFKIREYFSGYGVANVPLDTIRKIYDILFNKES